MALSARVQLRAVLVKNARLLHRNRGDLVREVLIPILLLVVVVLIRKAVKNSSYPSTLGYPVVPVAPSARLLIHLASSNSSAYQIVFAPCSGAPGDPVAAVAQRVGADFGVVTVCKACNAGCDDSVEGYYAANAASVLAGVVFDGDGSDVLRNGSAVRYNIRLLGDSYLPKVTGGSIFANGQTRGALGRRRCCSPSCRPLTTLCFRCF